MPYSRRLCGSKRMEQNWDIRHWLTSLLAPTQPSNIDSGALVPFDGLTDSVEAGEPAPRHTDGKPVSCRSENDKGLHINTLPLEIFQRIVSLLRRDNKQYAAACLSVCKHWHHAAKPLIRKALYMHDEELTSFALATWQGGSSFDQLRTLKVTLQNSFAPRCNVCHIDKYHINSHYGDGDECAGCSHEYRDCDETSASTWKTQKTRIHQDLTSLKHVLTTHLRQLSTFSLIVDNEPKDGYWCICYTSPISSTYFAAILRALPLTCRHLELDTRGADSGAFEEHICSELGRLLPHLKNLRLRAQSLCPAFFLKSHSETFLTASPFHEWLSSHRKQPLVAGLLTTNGECLGPGDDFLEWQRWNKLSRLRREVSRVLSICSKLTGDSQWWERHYWHELQSPWNGASQVCPRLETCIINLCLFPHLRNGSLHSQLEEAGVLAAATIAANLHHAKHTAGIFPSLHTCKILSSDFEVPRNEWSNLWQNDGPPHSGQSYGAASELIVHDVLNPATTIMPFRSIYRLDGDNLNRMRESVVHQWRNAADEAFEGSLSTVEPLIEGEWVTVEHHGKRRSGLDEHKSPSSKSIPVTSPRDGRKATEYHTETYSGLLDRAGIRDKRVEDDSAEWRYNKL